MRASSSKAVAAGVVLVEGLGQKKLLVAELGLVGSYCSSGMPLAMWVQRGVGPCRCWAPNRVDMTFTH